MTLLSALAHSLVSPLVHFFILVIIGLILHVWKTKHKLRNGLWVIACLWLLLCSQPMFSALLLRPLEFHFPAIKISTLIPSQVSGIAVLACYYHTNDDMPEISNWSECSLQRLLQARQAHVATKAPIFLTGGYFLKDKNISYAEQAKSLLVSLGVEERAVIVVSEGTNTHEEIDALYHRENVENFVVISSATHMRRLDQLLMTLKVKNYTLMPIDYLSGSDIDMELKLPAAYSIVRSERAIYEYFALAKNIFTTDTQ